ncbi:MAG: DUF2723 domain-containing protein [Elusimicrobia bacterium]|nr:DUF2723 domain-containing protein [Elusimicrobiota bacterium]
MPFLEPFLVFLAFLFLDVFCMAPGVTFGDSGELAAAAANLSVAHAPGYPLHALLGHLLGSAVPWGGWAYRTNLLTAILTAAALAVLGSALRLAGFSRTARSGAVLFLGLCGLWRHGSSVTEVFGLHLLALACVAWLVCRFHGSLWEPKPAAALGLAVGLGLANHHTLVLALPAVLWQAWKEKPALRKAAAGIGTAALLACCGMACYLYLPIRSSADPPLDWGDPTNLERFMRVLLRKDYGSFALTVEGAAPVSRWSQIPRYLGFTLKELGPAASALALVGLAAWSWLGIAVSWRFPALLAVLSGPFFLFLGNPPSDPQTSYALERFYLASWMGVAFLVAGGLTAVASFSPWAGRALLVIPIVSACLGWQDWFMRWDLTAHDYGRNILKTLPKGSTLFMDGGDDTFYSLAYLTQAQAMRQDLELHDRGGLVFRSAYGPDFRRLPKSSKEARRVSVETLLADAGTLFYSTLNDSLLPGFTLAPAGLLRKPVAGARGYGLSGAGGPGPDPWEFYVLRYSDRLLERHYRHRALIAFYPVMAAAGLAAQGKTLEAMMRLAEARAMGGDVLWLGTSVAHQLEILGFDAFQRGDWPSAEQAYAAAYDLDPDATAFLLNLGAARQKQGKLKEAEDAFQRCADRDPGSVKAWRNLGTVYWVQGRWKPAAEAFKTASSLAPADRELSEYAASAAKRAGP